MPVIDPSPQAVPSAIVIGGSMGGLFAANLLHRAGWSVRVFERSGTPLSSRGTGIVTNDGLRTLLGMAGVPVDASLGFEIQRRTVIDSAGQTLAEIHRPQTMTAWSRLLGLLLRALPDACYRLGMQAVDIDPGDAQRQARVRVASSGEDRAGDHLADLVVVADGGRSAFRGSLLGASPPVPAGYVAWRTLLPMERLDDETRRWIDGNFAFAFAPGEEIVGYPVLADDGTVMVNIVWYRDTSPRQMAELLTDESGRQHTDGIAPQLIRRSLIEAAKRDAAQALHPCWSRILSASTDWMLQVIVDSSTERMNAQRVAAIGDAAFVARPHVGQGVTKAAGDALGLVQALARMPGLGTKPDVIAALEAFSRQRVPVGHFAVDLARRLGAVVYREPASRTPDQSAHAAYYGDAMKLLADTAVELDNVANLGRLADRT